MADVLTKAQRSALMSRIRSRNTRPERVVRLALRHAGIRYRSHRKVARMVADVVLPELHMVILVHGCFWHGCPRHYVAPKSRAGFWRRKLEINRRRDRRVTKALRERGWHVAVVWECHLRENPTRTLDRALRTSRATLGQPKSFGRDRTIPQRLRGGGTPQGSSLLPPQARR